MWTYDNGSSRRSRDNPPSSSRRYYGPVYDQPYYDDAPLASSSVPYERHRRRSVPVNSTVDDIRQPRRAAVIASDDGSDKPFGRGGFGDPYSGTSRHDVETKTSDGNRHFRDKRGTYETDEGQALRRAKSYSPHRAAREVEATRRISPEAPQKSGRQEADYAAPVRRSSTRKGREQQQYYDEQPWIPYGKPPHRARTAYEYGGGAVGTTAPTTRNYPPFQSSPMTSSKVAPGEKVGRNSRVRDKPYYQDLGPSYAEAEPPRRDRGGRYTEGKPGWEDDGFAPRSRAKHRPPPEDDYEDPYTSAPRPRHRQSVPPQARSRYEDPSEDPYAPPRRRATSASQGSYGGYNNNARDRRYQDEEGYGSSRGGGSYSAAAAEGGAGSNRKKDKSKTIGKQAGKLFMTHAFPVIKQEAVPFLTKAAQAYFESSRK